MDSMGIQNVEETQSMYCVQELVYEGSINGHEITRHCDGSVFQRTAQGFVCVNEGGGRTVASESES